MADIAEILRQRSDISSFVVHLTRQGEEDAETPEANIKSILENRAITARTHHGFDKAALENADIRTVCFTETPFEYLPLLSKEIDKRQIQFSEWGLAFSKYIARLRGANPILYAHSFPNMGGGPYQPADALRSMATVLNKGEVGVLKKEDFPPWFHIALETLLAFSESMQRSGTPREWWWEREWRRVGDFTFSFDQVAFGLCPPEFVLPMEAWAMETLDHPIRFISSRWTIEEAISHLAGLVEEPDPWPRERYAPYPE